MEWFVPKIFDFRRFCRSVFVSSFAFSSGVIAVFTVEEGSVGCLLSLFFLVAQPVNSVIVKSIVRDVAIFLGVIMCYDCSKS